MLIRKTLVSFIGAAALAMVMAPSAQAHSNSGSADIPGVSGGTVTADIWIENFADFNNCGDFQTTAKVSMAPEWIKNETEFHANGVGASLKGAGLNFDGSSGSSSITNDQGQTSAHISGNVCGNFSTIYIGGSVNAKSLVNGNLVTATASV